MKTKIYKIAFQFIDTDMCTNLDISKKEFDRQLAFMREQVKTTAGNEYPIEEYPMNKKDCICYTETAYIFVSGCATTYLFELVCKNGYKFKN